MSHETCRPRFWPTTRPINRAPPEEIGFVVYDERCRLCSAWMHFVLARDKRQSLIFVPVNSWIGCQFLRSAGMALDNYDSMVFAAGNHTYLRSAAIIRILSRLPLPWCLARALLIIPESWRDRAYALLARNRYRWFGKCTTCSCATVGPSNRFKGHHAL